MRRLLLIWSVFFLWTGLFGAAFAAFQLSEPSGDGFVRGLNKVYAFLVWQLGAALIASVAFVLVRRYRKTSGPATRIAGYLPPTVSAITWLILIGFYVYAVLAARL